MPDLLVPLYKLTPNHARLTELREQGVVIRRAFPFDLSRIRRFIAANFSESWADEAEASFARQPIQCWIAIYQQQVIGFACVDATMRGFFGPTGVSEAHRGKGIGTALLIEALFGLKELGYGYGIIGSAGPVAFYEKNCGALVIPDSVPGVYVDLLASDGNEGSR